LAPHKAYSFNLVSNTALFFALDRSSRCGSMKHKTVAPVGPLLFLANLLSLHATVFQTRIGQTVPITGANNVIIVTIMPNFTIAPNTPITVSGLVGTDTASSSSCFPLLGTDALLFDVNGVKRCGLNLCFASINISKSFWFIYLTADAIQEPGINQQAM
jgi:hypothetical protein